MNGQLRSAFDGYLALGRDQLGRLRSSPGRAPLKLVRNSAVEIQGAVEELEGSAEFKELVLGTSTAFRNRFHSAKSDDHWRRGIGIFFRRSRAYVDLASTAVVDPQVLFDRYCGAFKPRDTKVLLSIGFQN